MTPPAVGSRWIYGLDTSVDEVLAIRDGKVITIEHLGPRGTTPRTWVGITEWPLEHWAKEHTYDSSQPAPKVQMDLSLIPAGARVTQVTYEIDGRVYSWRLHLEGGA